MSLMFGKYRCSNCFRTWVSANVLVIAGIPEKQGETHFPLASNVNPRLRILQGMDISVSRRRTVLPWSLFSMGTSHGLRLMRESNLF